MKQEHHILILTYWSYKDALIQTYTLPYVSYIRKVLPASAKIFLFTIEQPQFCMTLAEKEAVHAYLIQQNIHWMPVTYTAFGVKAIVWQLKNAWRLIRLIRKEKIDIVHAWCTPAGMLGYLLSTLTGKKLVLDSFEPHAEAMVENGSWRKGSVAFRLLFLFEKLQSRKAQHVIAAAAGMRSYAQLKYGANIQSFYVKPACVNTDLFYPSEKKDEKLLHRLGLNSSDKILLYAGKFGGIYLKEEVFDFFRTAASYWGKSFKVILLTNHTREEIEILCHKAGMDPTIVCSVFVSHHEVPAYMDLADVAITPVKPVPTKRYCTPIKDGEYWAMGLPVIIPDGISDDSDIIRKEGIGAVISNWTERGYLEALKQIDELLGSLSRKERIDKIRAVAIKYRNFDIAKKIYQEIYG